MLRFSRWLGRTAWLGLCALTCSLSGCGERRETHAQTTAVRTQFSLVTYNVAGLPALISQSEPQVNMELISPLLNTFDLALVQEDFSYHEQLTRYLTYPFRSKPALPGLLLDLGDGLNEFSRLIFHDFSRHAWRSCHGHLGDGGDCLTSKGYSLAVHELAPGTKVHIYNVHMDSGDSAGDVGARSDQVAQLATAIAEQSHNTAVVVAGDFNVSMPGEPTLGALMQAADLKDACKELNCVEQDGIDRVLFRSTPDLSLTVSDLRFDPRFVRDDGMPLSDHKPLRVTFEWHKLQPKKTRVARHAPQNPEPGEGSSKPTAL